MNHRTVAAVYNINTMTDISMFSVSSHYHSRAAHRHTQLRGI